IPAIPFTVTTTKMSVRVWSPDAGIQVLLKAEDVNDGSHSVETLMTVGNANVWEQLEFDFANERPGTPKLNTAYTYDKLTIFFDYDVDPQAMTQSDKIYYCDDLMFMQSP